MQQTVAANRLAESLLLARSGHPSTADECIRRREERQIGGAAIWLFTADIGA